MCDGTGGARDGGSVVGDKDDRGWGECERGQGWRGKEGERDGTMDRRECDRRQGGHGREDLLKGNRAKSKVITDH